MEPILGLMQGLAWGKIESKEIHTVFERIFTAKVKTC